MNNHPFITPDDVTPPAGTTTVDEWQTGPTHPTYRFIGGPSFHIDNGRGDDFEVLAMAAQLGDGGIDDGNRIEAPSVRIVVNGVGDEVMSAAQARELADRLIAAATWIDELDKPLAMTK
jgi:hypothetical protein